jgi:hypothetical protein
MINKVKELLEKTSKKIREGKEKEEALKEALSEVVKKEE